MNAVTTLVSNPTAASMAMRVGMGKVKTAVSDINKPPVDEEGNVRGGDTDEGISGVSLDENANELREHVNTLQIENNKLSSSIDDLESNVDALEEVEKNLRSLCNTDNLDRLKYVIKENGRVQKQIKEHLEAEVMQSVLTTVMRSDRDGNFTISGNEMKYLLMRMRNMPNVEFEEEVFKAQLEKAHPNAEGVKLADLMELFRNMLDKDKPQEESVFKIDPQKVVDEKRKKQNLAAALAKEPKPEPEEESEEEPEDEPAAEEEANEDDDTKGPVEI
eukprot:CAMPEP_0118723250 /NCGR_PEP_ID=MMETSP0800-20121206/31899_1 /TAXON_ID=210618 ORGANISM="Striatella unipunctata, Strain CCMP2910" /NCGR_SAMPLE_ID=MMETSP0800 /ASSEMBLY_ACC=CAM_ASM_000638 /LENGTH=274 /DNA_ID=CAMNT_0006631655 /DNA_START=59 /DNA_END=883 /DNA_ORIENTATION=+